jgi:hypothetical protein
MVEIREILDQQEEQEIQVEKQDKIEDLAIVQY